MSDQEALVSETRVLAIASHVVHGYVGNKVATFAMQVLGCDVSSMNTVNYSNHTGYKQVKGTKATTEQIVDLWQGLQDSNLIDFDMMLSGYMPSAEVVEQVAIIGKQLRDKAASKPGSFFWILDPVLGDNGRLYVPDAEVPIYKSTLSYCDLILPNQFELETLAEVKITDISSLVAAITKLHRTFNLPHIFVTSTQLQGADKESIAVVGSSATTDGTPRVFRINVPYFPAYFTGTGDLFAALLVGRLREEAGRADVLGQRSWRVDDGVDAIDLPLAKAARRVVASMQAVLRKTFQSLETARSSINSHKLDEKQRHLALTKAVELKVVKYVSDLLDPPDMDKIIVEAVEL